MEGQFSLQLIPIPIESLRATSEIWGPFVERIAKRQRCHLKQRLDDVYNGTVRLFVVWDEEKKEASALVGVSVLQRGDDRVGKITWVQGVDRKRWIRFYPELEDFCRQHLCCNGGMEALARPGWQPLLKELGFKLAHVHYIKDFA